MNIEMFFTNSNLVKGVIMTLTLKSGEVVKGQFELCSPNNQVCLFTDNDKYEYLGIGAIKSVLIEEE